MLAQGWGGEGMKDMVYASLNFILNWRNITNFLACFYITLTVRKKNKHIYSWQCWIWLPSLVLLWNMKREVATVYTTSNPLPNHFPFAWSESGIYQKDMAKCCSKCTRMHRNKVQGCTATQFGVSALLCTLILKPKQHKNHRTLTDVLWHIQLKMHMPHPACVRGI